MRLFVAIEAPEAWSSVAAGIQRGIPEELRRLARLVDPSLMHVTLRFIGEVEESELPLLQHALRERVEPFEVPLALGRIGTFGAPARTSVVWLGVQGDLERLATVARQVDGAVEAALGLPPEDRPYTPHVTLARVRQQVSASERRVFSEAMRSLDPGEPHPFTAREAVLIESRLSGSGPRYRVLGRYPGG